MFRARSWVVCPTGEGRMCTPARLSRYSESMSPSPAAEQPAASPTLADIAAEAKVSMSTVSKVLNGRSGVSESTRNRVERLLQEHGYSRRGTGQPSTLIEIVFSQLNSPWAIELIRGVESVAVEHGMSAVVTQSGDRHSPGAEWIEGAMRRSPAGVILVFSDLSAANKAQLRNRNIPFAI